MKTSTLIIGGLAALLIGCTTVGLGSDLNLGSIIGLGLGLTTMGVFVLIITIATRI